MPRKSNGRPTDAELEILKVLWELGPSTVRAVWQTVSQRRAVGHTSVLKIMQIMRNKGLIASDESRRPQVYRPVQRQETVLRQLAGDLLHRVFDGSTEKLLLHALDSKSAGPEELAAIRRLLAEIEGGPS